MSLGFKRLIAEDITKSLD